MKSWPDEKILKLLNISLPIIQAPMAGANGSAMAIEVIKAGALGSLPCAMLSADQIRVEVSKIRSAVKGSLNLNFFCHSPPRNLDKEIAWKNHLLSYYDEFKIDHNKVISSPDRRPFDEEMCDLMLELKPEVISFHFGLPEEKLIQKLKGIKIIASATTVDEAKFLADRGCDAVIAQGFEAGGHRGMFLSNDITTQVGTMALVPQMVDALSIPVIASGGISDARGIAASFILGASAVQLGTAYLFTPEATISNVHKKELKNSKDNSTVLTNLFSGKPARGIVNRLIKEQGAMSSLTPDFPLAGKALAPLKAHTEPKGSGDFMSMWSGQGASLCHEMGAYELTLKLASEALSNLR